MNYKGFKKVSSDNKCTTLKHDHGHILKIAHSALSSKMKKELDSLPVKMADGGDPKSAWDKFKDDISSAGSDASETLSPDSPQGYDSANAWDPSKNFVNQQSPAPPPTTQSAPVPAQDSPAVPDSDIPDSSTAPQQPDRSPATVQGDAPQSSDDSNETQSAPAVPDDSVPQQQASPTQAQQEYQQAFNNYKQAHQKEFAEQDAAFEQDLHNGHITPETYHSLFAKKDTMGKVGTIFGLMLSGAGSGLSHQPNALLASMNQEINNDLQAQMQSKGNAQNFIKLNQAQQLQDAQIGNMVKTGQLTDAQAQAMKSEAGLKSFILAQLQANRAALHDQSQMVAKMPEGPQKEQAKQVLAMMGTAVNGENANIGDLASSKLALLSSVAGNGQGGMNGTALRMMGQKDLAEDVESKTVPGIPGRAQVPLNSGDRDAINSGVEFDQKLHRFIDWTKGHSGDLNPADRNAGVAMAAELQGAYRQATHGGVYKEGEQNFISKLIDSDPTKFFNNIRVLPQLNAIANENKARVNQLVKSKGFPGYQGAQSQPDVRMSKSGKPMIQKNGKWVYQ